MASKDALTVYTGLTHGHIPIVTMTTVYTGLMHGHIPIVTTLTVYTDLTHGHIPIVTTLTVYTGLMYKGDKSQKCCNDFFFRFFMEFPACVFQIDLT